MITIKERVESFEWVYYKIYVWWDMQYVIDVTVCIMMFICLHSHTLVITSSMAFRRADITCFDEDDVFDMNQLIPINTKQSVSNGSLQSLLTNPPFTSVNDLKGLDDLRVCDCLSVTLYWLIY